MEPWRGVPAALLLRRCDLSPDYKRAKFKEGGQAAREDVAVLDTGQPPPSLEGRRQLVAPGLPRWSGKALSCTHPPAGLCDVT